MFHQSHHLAKKHTVHLSYVMFYSSAYEDAAEWSIEEKRKKNIKNEKPAATWSQGFFCCLTPPQITLFFSLLLKTKVQHREIKNAIWSFYFQACGSSSFSSWALSLLIPVTSCPCGRGRWLTGRCLHSLHVREQVKPCSRQTSCTQFPLNTLHVKYLEISLFMIGPPRAEKQVIPTFYHLFSSYFFSLFWAAVTISPFPPPFLVLCFPGLPKVFSPESPASILPFSIGLSTSHSSTFCSFILRETLGLN